MQLFTTSYPPPHLTTRIRFHKTITRLTHIKKIVSNDSQAVKFLFFWHTQTHKLKERIAFRFPAHTESLPQITF